ncbi:MAG: hypothetical protein JXB46_08765 [Candidatus Eisenbacteria bacterium]|nr:hypothetical protein [Candidatus Eisenbacteria bacterium]
MLSESRTALAVERAAAEQLARLAGGSVLRDDHPSYTKTIEDNLIDGVRREDFSDDLMDSDAGALRSIGGTPEEMCAVHSSLALAVNTFAPFRRSPSDLLIPGMGRFACSRFSKKLRTGIGEEAHPLAFYAIGPNDIAAVEVVFGESLRPKRASFSESMAGAVEELAEGPWLAMHDSLVKSPGRFRLLDAATLVRQYLGLKRSLRDEPARKTLLYLFWEPRNWRRVEEYSQHRFETVSFCIGVAGGDIRFEAMSFDELWSHWERESTWPEARSHAASLRARYDFEI